MIEQLATELQEDRKFERYAVRIALVREPGAKSQPLLDRPEVVAEVFRTLTRLDRECVAVALLDARNRLCGIHAVHVGTTTHSTVGVADVFKAAILANAHAAVVVHNHPSGDPTPSNDDIDLTRRLQDAGRLLGIAVLDHVIVADDSFVSLRQRGLA
ncbi:MAG: RadC family protein [Thermoanaerobaculaceae bacterium]